jgi:hypothetical protein
MGPVIAALVVRLALLAVVVARNASRTLVTVDTGTYLEPGRNLLLHGRFISGGAPELSRTPGYPLFLALTSFAGFPAAAVANVILSAFSVFLVWRLGRTIFRDDGIALGAAWIFAFEPISTGYSVTLMSETLFVAILLLSMERLAAFLRDRRLGTLAAAGVLLAAATLVRPVSYYLPVALALGLALVLARVPGLRWKAPAVLLISVLPWLAAWQIRNWAETGYSGFSSVSEDNLYFLIATSVTARAEHRPYDFGREIGYLGYFDDPEHHGQLEPSPAYIALHPERAEWDAGQELTFRRSEAFRVIRAHFGDYLSLCFKSLSRIVFEPGAGYFDHLVNPEGTPHTVGLSANRSLAHEGIALAVAYPWVAAEKVIFGVALIGLYLFAARGVFRAGMHDACLWLLLGSSLYFLAVSAAGAGQPGSVRFRLPVMPAVCILAAVGIKRRGPESHSI